MKNQQPALGHKSKSNNTNATRCSKTALSRYRESLRINKNKTNLKTLRIATIDLKSITRNTVPIRNIKNAKGTSIHLHQPANTVHPAKAVATPARKTEKGEAVGRTTQRNIIDKNGKVETIITRTIGRRDSIRMSFRIRDISTMKRDRIRTKGRRRNMLVINMINTIADIRTKKISGNRIGGMSEKMIEVKEKMRGKTIGGKKELIEKMIGGKRGLRGKM